MDPLSDKDSPEHPESNTEMADPGGKSEKPPAEPALPPAILADSDPPQESTGADPQPGAARHLSSETIIEEKTDVDPAASTPGGSLNLLHGCSRRDIIWLSALGITIIFVAIIALYLFFGNINTSTKSTVDFPVRGENLVIRNIETYWRKVNREEDVGVQLNTKFIPVAQIALKSSGVGSLRVFFENPKGDIVGDSVTRGFSEGTFDDAGKETINIHSTGGFADLGDYNDYLTEQVHFWSLVVKEGAGAQPKGEDFKEIVRMRISPKRR